MAASFIYLSEVFFKRISGFLRHWYRDGFLFFLRRTIDILERLDGFFALAINFRHLFQPLYRERNFIGYLLGFIFRGVRIVVAALFYAAIILFGFLLFLLWAMIPLGIVYKIIM